MRRPLEEFYKDLEDGIEATGKIVAKVAQDAENNKQSIGTQTKEIKELKKIDSGQTDTIHALNVTLGGVKKDIGDIKNDIAALKESLSGDLSKVQETMLSTLVGAFQTASKSVKPE